MGDASIGSELRKIAYARAGAGPLLERDYLGVITDTRCEPEDLARRVREQFAALAPPETAHFQHPEGRRGEPLEVGDELKIRIGGLFPCCVRVVAVDRLSLTLRTLAGHPEAGRITFGAGRDDQGRLTFRIRSRARAGGLLHYLGFFLLGRAMQARCWIRFIRKLAHDCGGRLAGPIQVRTDRVAEEPADCGGPDLPTFTCGGGA
jgi:hypothetical protein